MSKLRLFILTGLLAASVAPLYGCGNECGPGTTDQDGQCVLVAKGCGENTLLENKQCVVNETGCADGTVLENGICVPAEASCAEGTSFDQGSGTCVPNTDIVCGSGTEANDDGVCVPAAEACGDKTTLENGICVIEAAACGAGTELDPNTGDCALADAACGDGTALDGDTGACVPTAEVCDTGTKFDGDSGLCLPDSCQEGDVLVNSVCMSPAQELATNADLTETEPNDPAFEGGTAGSLTVNAVDGDPFVFAGTIGAPTDIDGDGNLDQDVDVFEFTATEGDWFELMVQSTGLPAPAFIVEGPNDYMRWSPTIGGGATARDIVIPEDGTYTVTVLPSLNVASNDVGPSGSDDWGYVGTLKAVTGGTAVDSDIASGSVDVSGELTDLHDNMFNLTNITPTDVVTFSANGIGEDANAVLQVWSDATTLHDSQPISVGQPVTVGVPETGSMIVLVDWTTADGPRDDFDITAEVTGAQQTITIPAGDTGSMTVSTELFDLLEISQSNAAGEALDLSITDPNSTEVATTTLDDGELFEHIVFNTGGDYVFTLTNNSAASVDATLGVNIASPQDVGQLPTGGTVSSSPINMLQDDVRYFSIAANADELVEVLQDNDEASDVEILVYDIAGAEVDEDTAFDAASNSSGGEYVYGRTSGSASNFLVRVIADDGDLTNEVITANSRTYEELGQLATDTTTDTTTIPALGEDQMAYVTFTVAAGEVFALTHTNDQDEEINSDLYGPNGDSVVGGTFIDVPTDSGYTYSDFDWYWVRSDTTFTLEVEATSDLTNLLVTLHSITPGAMGELNETASLSDTGGPILEDMSDFHTFSTTSSVVYSGLVSPAAGEDVDLFIYDTSGSQVVGEYGSGGDVATGGEIPAAGDYLVRVEGDDAVSSYTISLNGSPRVVDLGLLPANQLTEHTMATYGDDQPLTLQFEVPAGQIIEIYHDNDGSDDHDFELFDGSGTSIESNTYFYPTSYSGPEYIYHYTDTGGTFELEIMGRDSVTNQTFSINLYQPQTLGPLAQGQSQSVTGPALLENQRMYYLVELSDTGDFQIEGTSGNTEDIDLDIWDMGLTSLDSETASGGIYYLSTGYSSGTYFVSVEGDDTPSSFDLTVALNAPHPAPVFTSAPALSLPDNDPTGVTDTITVSGCATLTEVEVFVQFTHDDTGDPAFTITSPNGTSVVLRETDAGGSNGTRETVGTWYPYNEQPVGDLTTLNGETGNGDWVLKASDEYSGDLGQLDEWGLTLGCQ